MGLNMENYWIISSGQFGLPGFHKYGVDISNKSDAVYIKYKSEYLKQTINNKKYKQNKK